MKADMRCLEAGFSRHRFLKEDSMLVLKMTLNNEVVVKTRDGDVIVKVVKTAHGNRMAFVAPRHIEIRRRDRDEPTTTKESVK